MASPDVIDFHNRKMAQEREFVKLRIDWGTKASSPQIKNARRMNPLYYSNPLPDNSTGSKNRPFGLNKDESGRPSADAIASGKILEGGVLKDYKYAKAILARRGRDTTNINLASEGLPPQPSPLLELSPVDSKILELDSQLQLIDDSIAVGNVNNITVEQLKNITRLIISLVPALTEEQIATMIQYVTEMIEDIDNLLGSVQELTLKDYFQMKLIPFLKENVTVVNFDIRDRQLFATESAKRIFKFKPARAQKALKEAEEIPEEMEEVPETEEVIETEEASKIENAINFVDNFTGSVADFERIFRQATGRSSEGRTPGNLRRALKTWIRRNADKERFNTWYERNVPK